MVMESGSSSGVGSPQCPLDFSFAFNNVLFSDRILKIEITDDPPESRPDRDGHANVEARNWSGFGGKETFFLGLLSEEMATEVVYLSGGREAAQGNEASPSMDRSVVRERIIYFSSLILAAHSPFFHELFSNGMRETKQQQVTLSIQASDEASLMDLLNFMYSNTLTRTTPCALLDVLVIADKFQVDACLRYCSQLLLKLPMDYETALLYLNLPPTVLMSDSVRPLKDGANKFLAAQFKDIGRFQEEVLNLPLAGIEAVLSSDDLEVATEYDVYDIVLKWARKHYPELEERREIVKTRLLRLIRFPLMISGNLKEVLTCNDIDPQLASRIVLESLFFKAKASHRQRYLTAEQVNSTTSYFLVERAYKFRPIQVVEFELPRIQSIVYFDLKKEECLRLFPSGQVHSQFFHLGRQQIFLTGQCITLGQHHFSHSFGLFLFIDGPTSAPCTVVYELASRTKHSEEFVTWWLGTYTFDGGKKTVGHRNMFGVPWTAFIADGSPFFINDILHLRAELTIEKDTDEDHLYGELVSILEDLDG
ncbi:UNVERIFIED_CONTAM: BTB/POZ domain-containing protein POB1 [Sesamum latifolium]|uniref:BTB/POZ domain-containing protein POB1 n=1 Tax=Sesamum latifolium TaxID=2727402 RepID=A0AAW2SPD1_9LAMI